MPVDPWDEKLADIRRFGSTVGGILIFAAVWWFFRGKLPIVREIAGSTGIILFVLGMTRPALLSRPFTVWIAIADLMGRMMTMLILFVVYVTVVTPTGLSRRVLADDSVSRPKQRPSYWTEYPARQQDSLHYKRMF